MEQEPREEAPPLGKVDKVAFALIVEGPVALRSLISKIVERPEELQTDIAGQESSPAGVQNSLFGRPWHQ